MSIFKRLALVLTAVVMSLPLYCCAEKEEDASDSSSAEVSDSASESEVSEESSEESSAAAYVQQDIPQEYDGSEIDDACAQTISRYFTAIMNQEYEEYEATLDPYYLQVYDDWLDGNFGYGMETSFETMHQSLMDAASVDEEGNAITVEKVTITKIALSPAEPTEEESDINEAIDTYLASYDSAIGEGFTEELKKQCDEVIAVRFTMTADCDGTERDILTDMELLMTVTDGEYRILG
ncbi:MAG: hypothetical protein IJ496_00165 [Ruminococcus sp.]|nr:hypothetical protein [Ruminococcus sp.]